MQHINVTLPQRLDAVASPTFVNATLSALAAAGLLAADQDGKLRSAVVGDVAVFLASGVPAIAGAAFLRVLSDQEDDDVVDFAAAYQAAAWANGGAGGNENYVDHVYAIGINVDDVGTKKDPAKTYAALHFESKFSQGGGGPYANEFFLHYIDAADVVHRQLSLFLPHTGSPGSSGSVMTSNVDTINWHDWGGTQRVKWNVNNAGQSYGEMLNNFFFRFATNNYAALRQRNAADNADLNLPFFGGDDRLSWTAAFSAVGTTPTTGTFANTFARIQATSLPANGKVLSVVGPTLTGSAGLVAFSGSATSDLYGRIENTNSNGAAAHAVLELLVGGVNGGDPKIYFNVSGGTRWQVGVDNSVSDQFVWATATLGAGGQDRMVLDTNGNLIVYANLTQSPAPSISPASNGQMVVEATNNATLTFKLKGSDGIVRSGPLTLS